VRQIEEILWQDLKQAQKNHDRANAEFWRVSIDIPSGLPHPDGSQRIQNAARAQNASRAAVVVALKRLNNYLSSGIVPDDLNTCPDEFNTGEDANGPEAA
jgi:hypothetical protein